jgi:hypothetical protein
VRPIDHRRPGGGCPPPLDNRAPNARRANRAVAHRAHRPCYAEFFFFLEQRGEEATSAGAAASSRRRCMDCATFSRTSHSGPLSPMMSTNRARRTAAGSGTRCTRRAASSPGVRGEPPPQLAAPDDPVPSPAGSAVMDPACATKFRPPDIDRTRPVRFRADSRTGPGSNRSLAILAAEKADRYWSAPCGGEPDRFRSIAGAMSGGLKFPRVLARAGPPP